MTREDFTAQDGKIIKLALWENVENPRGVVQIVHGMSEHIARYDEFARYLNSRGFIVVGDDHRAHGLTDADALGKAGDGDLFEKTVADERDITETLKTRYGLPVALFGHSYGSFLAQRYLSLGEKSLACAVLCGSAFQKGIAVNLGYAIAKGRFRRHRDEAGKTFAALTFDGYDRKFREGKGGWLNTDPREVGKYNTDPLCGFTCSNGFYYWFFRGLKTIAAEKPSLSPSFPLFIVSGADDMVGGKGKLVRALCRRYEQIGLHPTLKLYEGARHEILNEPIKEQVYSDLADFFAAHI